MPRRPARPVSWVYSPGVRSACASPLNLTSRSSTTVRAGMLMPSASVSVAKTASHQAADEQLLDGLLERRQQPGVVRGDAPLQRVAPLPVAQHAQVGCGRSPVRRSTIRRISATSSSVVSRSPARTHWRDGGVAAGAAEDEDDRREQAVAVQPVEHGDPRRRPEPGAPRGRARRGARAAAAVPDGGRRTARSSSRVARTSSGVDLQLAVAPSVAARTGRAAGCRPACAATAAPDGARRPRPGVAAHGDQPVAELLGVGHRRRQADQRDVLGQLDDDLLPDRAAEPVGQVVHLVHDDVAEPVQRALTGRRSCCAAPRWSSPPPGRRR